MSKYTYSTNNGEIEHLNKQIFISLMKLGFRITSIGTIYLKNVIITFLLTEASLKHKDLTYSQSINILSKDLKKCPVSIKSNISKSFEVINRERYIKNFPKIFKYETDESSITPPNLYESFSALYQLKNSTI